MANLSWRNVAPILAGVAVGGLVGAWILGQSADEPISAPAPTTLSNAIATPGPALTGPTYEPVPIGSPVAAFGRPLVTHVKIADLDQDGLLDVIYCEAQLNTVRWIRQAPRGVFTESILADGVSGPAHVDTADLYSNGRLDVLVACMGQIAPNNSRIGTVLVLEQRADGSFVKHELLTNTTRVTDLRAANFSGHTDGRLDLVAGQFGYDQGEVRWLRNDGNWNFTSTVVNTQSGTVHTPIADFDGDGSPDFAALITQEWEEVHLFTNQPAGVITDSILWASSNEDYGSSGLEVADLNQDGRPDLIYTNGDGFDYSIRGPRPWHGMQWLENLGDGKFDYHHVGDLPGAFGPCAADLNGDGHLDLIAVSGYGDWSNPDSVTLMAWLNDGEQNFRPWPLATAPIQLITAAIGDLDGTGVPVIVTGGFHSFPPYERMSNVTLWRKR
jgi:hypothetical protein